MIVISKSLALAVFVCFSFTAYSAKYSICGYVQDASSGEKLIGASVYDEISGLGTITNEYGYYTLTLSEATVVMVVSYVGYTTYRDSLQLKKNIEKVIKLEQSALLEEVIVTSNSPKSIVENSQMSMISIPVKEIKSIPMFLGEADIIKTIQLMPGVQSGTEGTSGIYVRGGGPDQNLFLLDGVPIYNASHLFGFFSVFNPDAISHLTLTKGGFPAHYGGRLSSVVDIRLKEGNMKKIKGSGSIGLLASKFMLEGPVIKDKMSFVVSARRTYFDALMAPVIKNISRTYNSNSKQGYFFYDINAKLNYKISNKDRIYLSTYTGKDKLYEKSGTKYIENDVSYNINNQYGLKWGNSITALRWNHIFGSKLFCNTSLIYSNYRYNNFDYYSKDAETYNAKDDTLDQGYTYDNYCGIEDYGGIIDFDFRPSPNHSIRFGGKYLYHKFNPNTEAIESFGQSDSIINKNFNHKVYANEYYLYGEDNLQIGPKIRANIGIHYSAFFVNGQAYHSIQPRLSGRYLLTKNASVKVAFSRMDQNIHLLTNSTIGLPNDLWVPATDRTPPQSSYQSALGMAYNLNNSWSFTLEGFYKTMTGLIDYKDGASLSDKGSDWEEAIETGGKGVSYGLEFLARKELGKFKGWVGYTLSNTNRTFENINNGLAYPYTYDRRHDISLVLMYKLNERTDFGLTWVYGTGKATTLGVSRYQSLNPEQVYSPYYEGNSSNFNRDNDIEYYNGKNGYREPDYHRLDISINRHKKKKWGHQTWSFGLYNAYNQMNPFYLYFGFDKKGNRQLFSRTFFPIIPSISYSFEF
jgi:outer membrane receptor for ferrienterochelin and colicin